MKLFNLFKKKPQPVVDITRTESILVNKAKLTPESLSLREIAALKKIVARIENQK